jgi:hypothetical protein
LRFLLKISALVLLFYPGKIFSDTNSIIQKNHINNFGMPGLITLPSASSLPDGEMIVNQVNHNALSRSGYTFQLSPNIGLSFRYSGHGKDGLEAAGRTNHDRSFDIDFGLLKETTNFPALNIGLKDFIGTGWYSSEYIVGTKNIGDFSLSAGLGFGRLAGRNQIKNPFSIINKKFLTREKKDVGTGGTLGNLNWFNGPMSPFVGLRYDYNRKTSFLIEYTPDLMLRERNYLKIKSPINASLSYNLNESFSLNAQYLHGSTIAVGANIKFNPKRPPNGNGKDKATLPLRKKSPLKKSNNQTNISEIKAALLNDEFIVHKIHNTSDIIKLEVENKQYRSTAQALGRISRTVQRHSQDNIKFAYITLLSNQLPIATYHVDLLKLNDKKNIIKAYSDIGEIVTPQLSPKSASQKSTKYSKFKVGIGPYFNYSLFDPKQPIKINTGLELNLEYEIYKNVSFSGTVKKPLFSDYKKNIRISNSELPHVQSDFAIYNKEGYPGHFHNFKIKHQTKVSKNIYSSISAGYLEPMYAGISGELLHKNPKSNFAFGIDLSAVQMRDYDMMFGLRDYQTITSHLNFYYDPGNSYDLEINLGRYLAKDLGVTTKLSRRFGNGWSVGAYATFTDVPFDTFGEGSFDKAVFVKIPLDWFIGTPSKSKARFDIRPITRDGGAMLGSSKTIFNSIKNSSYSEIKREYGRFFK